MKPIWLLMMKWIEPPVRWPFRPDRPRHSATTPWPAKAASPWMSSGTTRVRSTVGLARWSCLARTLPSTTGSTISRWDGLAVSERWTLLPSKARSDEAPRWYFTSPEPSTSAGFAEPPLNSLKTARKGLAITLVSTLRRPRWAMPTTISSAPSAPPRLMICSRAGIIASDPSRPKRLVPVYLRSRNFSKPSASISLLRIARRPSGVKVISLPLPSMRSWIHAFSSGLEMCMNSTPRVLQ